MTKRTYNPNDIAGEILKENRLTYMKKAFYEYKNGVWNRVRKMRIAKKIKSKLGRTYTKEAKEAIYESMSIDASDEDRKINPRRFINLKNGLFDLNNHQLRDHSDKIYSTYQLPIKFDPHFQCLRWKKFLNEIFFDDKAKITLIQEWFGYTLLPTTKLEKWLILFGKGANGKSTLIKVWQRLLGERNCSSINMSQIGKEFYAADLFNKLANFSAEVKAHSAVQDSMIKKITSGERITVEKKYEHPFQFKPYARLIFAMNKLPRIYDDSYAFKRRLRIIRFNKIFRPAERDRSLESKLLKELSGIFNWAVEGLIRLAKNGDFLEPKEYQDQTGKFINQSNQLSLFIKQECLIEPNNEINISKLYKAYLRWVKNSNYKHYTQIKFSKAIKRCYGLSKIHKSDGDYWEGIALKGLVFTVMP